MGACRSAGTATASHPALRHTSLAWLQQIAVTVPAPSCLRHSMARKPCSLSGILSDEESTHFELSAADEESGTGFFCCRFTEVMSHYQRLIQQQKGLHTSRLFLKLLHQQHAAARDWHVVVASALVEHAATAN